MDTADEITRETLLTRGGEVVHPRVSSSSQRTNRECGSCALKRERTPSFTFRILPGNIKTVGRATRADFTVDAALVSRIHCRLTAGATEIEVVDLDSTNGTFVNGERVDKRKTVKAGDRIGIGRVDLMVEFTPQAG